MNFLHPQKLVNFITFPKSAINSLSRPATATTQNPKMENVYTYIHQHRYTISRWFNGSAALPLVYQLRVPECFWLVFGWVVFFFYTQSLNIEICSVYIFCVT